MSYNAQLYYVENMGCDDTSYGLVAIPDEIFPKFKSFVENLNKNSTYSCKPRIGVWKVTNPNILREATDEDDPDDYLYFNDKVFVIDWEDLPTEEDRVI